MFSKYSCTSEEPKFVYEFGKMIGLENMIWVEVLSFTLYDKNCISYAENILHNETINALLTMFISFLLYLSDNFRYKFNLNPVKVVHQHLVFNFRIYNYQLLSFLVEIWHSFHVPHMAHFSAISIRFTNGRILAIHILKN